MLFPLKFLPKESYKEAPRHFGARRSKGKRKHAGCDLYAPVGTPIFAVADGVVLDFYEFYLESWALEVDHGDFVVRYGEVKKTLPAGVKKGAKVFAGQHIANVGVLQGLKLSMLHFEMYAGTAKGALTQKGNPPYQRRSDLMDPTPYLDSARMFGVTAFNPCVFLPGMSKANFGFTAGMGLYPE